MRTGKLIFAQAMDYLPQHTLRRCIQRYNGNQNIKSFSCKDQYRCMALAQLTYRESLRDIEACLKVQSNKLYHMGIRSKVAHSTVSRCKRKTRLADLCRFCSISNTNCLPTLCQRSSWTRTTQHHLCTQCHNHRSLPVSLPLGSLSESQRCYQTAYFTRILSTRASAYVATKQ